MTILIGDRQRTRTDGHVVPSDVRAFVADRHLTDRSSGRAAGHCLAAVVLFVGAGVAAHLVSAAHISAMATVAAWCAAWWLQALVLVGSYSAMHEAAHRTLFRSRRANRVAGVLWGATIGINSSLWRSFHLEHHAYTSGPLDPEPRVEFRSLVHYMVLIPIGGLAFVVSLAWSSVCAIVGRSPRFVRSESAKRAARVDGIVVLAIWSAGAVLAVQHPGLAVTFWLAPWLVCMLLVFPATGLSEHYGCAVTSDVFANTRSVQSNRLTRFLVWNNNFHAAHHLCPAVPFHHAAELQRYIDPRCLHLETSYVRFHAALVRRLLRTDR